MGSYNYAVDVRHIHREPAAGAVTATASYGDAAASQAYVDMGAATNTHFVTVVNIEAIKVSANDELGTFQIHLSNTSDFSTLVVAASETVGPTEVRAGGEADSAAGDEFHLQWSTRKNGVEYRYWRLHYLEDSGGTAPSIQFNAYSSKRV